MDNSLIKLTYESAFARIRYFSIFFLFDTKGKLPGGNGYAFDWTLLNAYPSEKPFFLSGGIGPNEIIKIKDLINTSLPLYAIDVNSKFEYSPGLKNIDLIRQFKKQLDEL